MPKNILFFFALILLFVAFAQINSPFTCVAKDGATIEPIQKNSIVPCHNAKDDKKKMLVNAIPMPEWLQKLENRDLNKAFPGDEAKIRYVVQLANENVKKQTGGPFAAAIFDMKTDRLVALGINVVVPSNQSWAHAEMIAFAHAQNRLKTHSLKGYVLVTSCEPCAMCSGATPWSGVQKMIFGATKKMAESAGFDEGHKGEKWRDEFERRGITVVGPLLGNTANEPFELYRKKQGPLY